MTKGRDIVAWMKLHKDYSFPVAAFLLGWPVVELLRWVVR